MYSTIPLLLGNIRLRWKLLLVVEDHVDGILVPLDSTAHLFGQHNILCSSSAYDNAGGLVLEVRMVSPFLPSVNVGNMQLVVSAVHMAKHTSMYGTDTPSRASLIATL